MAAVDDPKTLGRASLSFASEEEIDEFVATLERFERGELTPDAWRAFRLVRGTYGQRQTGDVQMLRVKIPQGILSAEQLLALADVAETYSRGFGHITTRQNLQFHFMKLHDVEPAMRRLAAVGLTTREACGNSVRNVTACPYAGVAPDEVFDVTPYADALTRHLLRHPLSSSLPRKFKIAWEGCASDHSLTGMHDLGFRARMGALGRRGFRVTVGGGTAILCRSGQLLFDFLPAGDVLEVAEAVVRVFHRFGDYQHRQRNRLKFLIEELGFDRFRAQFDVALAEKRSEGRTPLPFDPERPAAEEAPDWPRPAAPTPTSVAARASKADVRGPGLMPEPPPPEVSPIGGFLHWRRTNVRPQRQLGYAIVTALAPLGDLTGSQLRILADLSPAYGDGTIRVTSEQDLLFRWVPEGEVASLYERLVAAGLGLPDATTIADVTSCPGAESCKLAVTQSRGLGRLLSEHLRSRPDLVALASDISIKMSGCPNGCGRHHVAGLGFQGSVRRLGNRVVPQYFVMVGGGPDEEGVRFGRLAAKVPSRRVPQALERLLALYQAERVPGETATAFFQRVEPARAKSALADLERLTPEDAVPEDYLDLGEDSEFKVETSAGECSA
jgi:sulfite reductase (NADPH) hemoprotein beta-component